MAQVTTIAGSTTGFGDGSSSSALFQNPTGIATDTGGNIFVADANNKIRRIDWITRMVTTVAGDGSVAETDGVGTASKFNYPFGLAIFNGEIWVATLGGGKVRHIGMMSSMVIYIKNAL